MFMIYVIPLCVGAIIIGLTFWITKKAYSKKWEDE